MTVTLAVPVPMMAKIRVLGDAAAAIFVSDGDAPEPSMVSASDVPEVFWITNWADVVIEAETGMM
jgi:hypothetical protein